CPFKCRMKNAEWRMKNTLLPLHSAFRKLVHPAGFPPADSPFEAEDDNNFTTDAKMTTWLDSRRRLAVFHMCKAFKSAADASWRCRESKVRKLRSFNSNAQATWSTSRERVPSFGVY